MSNTLEKIGSEQQSQFTNTLKVSGKVNILVDDAANDESMTSLFGINSAKTISLPSERIPHKQKEVQEALAECDLLSQKNREYEHNFIVLGNQALYELLTSIYTFALKLEKSDFKYEILGKMREHLRSKDIRVQTNTPDLTILIKYIIGSDRKKATNYCRILKIALEERLAPEELGGYISRRGGIGQIHEIEVLSASRELGHKTSKERLLLMREYLTLQQWESGIEFKYDHPIIQHNSDKQTKAETATFCIFVADYDRENDVYRVISGHDLGRTYEDSFLRLVVKDATSDIEKIRKGIVRYKKKLLTQQKLPPRLAEDIQKELSELEVKNQKSY